jgi:hypothetical protein
MGPTRFKMGPIWGKRLSKRPSSRPNLLFLANGCSLLPVPRPRAPFRATARRITAETTGPGEPLLAAPQRCEKCGKGGTPSAPSAALGSASPSQPLRAPPPSLVPQRAPQHPHQPKRKAEKAGRGQQMRRAGPRRVWPSPIFNHLQPPHHPQYPQPPSTLYHGQWYHMW